MTSSTQLNIITTTTVVPTSEDDDDDDEFMPGPEILIPTGIGLYSLSLATIIGNAMVLHAIRTEKRLQTVSNMFIMSLAMADLMVGLFVMPVSSAHALTGDWQFGYIVCQIWLALDYTASTASIFNLFILSLDRYWSITSPLRYLRRRTKKRALFMIGIAWAASAMWFIPILGWQHVDQGTSSSSDQTCETSFAKNITFKAVTSILNFYLPTTGMIILYLRIFLAIKQRSRDLQQFEVSYNTGLSLQANQSKAKNTARSCVNDKKETGFIENNPQKAPPDLLAVPFINIDSNEITDHSLGGDIIRVEQTKDEQESSCEYEGLGLMDTVTIKTKKKQLEIKNKFRPLNIFQPRSTTSNSKSKAIDINESSDKSSSNISKYKGVKVCVEYVGGGGSNGSGVETSSDIAAATVCNDDKTQLSKPETTLVDGKKNLCVHRHHKHCYRSSISHKKSSSSLVRTESSRTQPQVKPQLLRSNTWRETRIDKIIADKCDSVSLDNQKVKHKPNEESTVHHALSWTAKCRNGYKSRLKRASYKKRQTTTTSSPRAVLAKEKKAATQLGVILGAFIFCWLPYFTLFIIVAFCGKTLIDIDATYNERDECVSKTVFTVSIWFGYFNSTINPILYPLCNANFKIAFKKMLHLSPQPGGQQTQMLPRQQTKFTSASKTAVKRK